MIRAIGRQIGRLLHKTFTSHLAAPPSLPAAGSVSFLLLVVSGVAYGLDPTCDNRLLSPRRSFLAVTDGGQRQPSQVTVDPQWPLTGGDQRQLRCR